MKQIIVLGFLCCAFTVQAQFISGAGAGNNVLRETQYTSVDGSPYYLNDWTSGSIRDKSGRLSENLMVRYDCYRDEVQFLKEGRNLVVEPALVSEFFIFVLDDGTKKVEKRIFKNGFTIEGCTKLNYLQVLYEGKIQFVKRVKVDYIEETVNNFGTNEIVKKFVRTEAEYLILNGSANKISKGRKDILSYFKNISKEVNSYIKENKLSFKDDAELAIILKKIDELTTQQ